MNIEIIYEDEAILALNKPAGLVVHSDGRTKEPSLVDWVSLNYPDILNVGEPQKLANGEMVKRPGVVHRLDRETSGVITLAKNNKAFDFLKKQFQDRSVSKLYNAFIYGNPKEKQGTIDIPIGRSQSDFRLWVADDRARGTLREAVTEYKVIKEGEDVSFIELRPKTGRTHQIRVHMKAINHPVVCDKRYAPKRPCVLGFERLALHSRSIELNTPKGILMTIEADLPSDFLDALEQLNSNNLAV